MADEIVTTEAPATPEPPVTETKETTPPPETKETSSLMSKATEETKEETKEISSAIDTKALKLPEGFSTDDKVLGSFTALLADTKMSGQERAQALLDMHTSALQAAAEMPSKAWNEVTMNWHKEIAQDRTIGTGDLKNPLKADVKTAIAKVLDKYGGEDLRSALDITGAGHNPAMIRFVNKIAPLLVETSKHVQGTAPAQARPRTAASALYPDNPE